MAQTRCKATTAAVRLASNGILVDVCFLPAILLRNIRATTRGESTRFFLHIFRSPFPSSPSFFPQFLLLFVRCLEIKRTARSSRLVQASVDGKGWRREEGGGRGKVHASIASRFPRVRSIRLSRELGAESSTSPESLFRRHPVQWTIQFLDTVCTCAPRIPAASTYPNVTDDYRARAESEQPAGAFAL